MMPSLSWGTSNHRRRTVHAKLASEQVLSGALDGEPANVFRGDLLLEQGVSCTGDATAAKRAFASPTPCSQRPRAPNGGCRSETKRATALARSAARLRDSDCHPTIE